MIWPDPYPRPAEPLPPGSLCLHEDDRGAHLVVLLEDRGPGSRALMLTSTPRWARGARRVTREEQAMIGLPLRVTSYWAPVTVDSGECRPYGRRVEIESAV